jgi:hypothetical protein
VSATTRPTAAAGPRPGPDRSAPERSGEERSGEDQVQLEASAIRGNQELPKVLYIVPWKDPAMAELAGRPVNSLVEEVLAPVDREVFRRQTRYFGQLYGAGSAQSAAVPEGLRDGAASGQKSTQ